QQSVEDPQGLADAGAREVRLEEEDFANQAEDMADALARRDKLLDTVGKMEQTDAIVIRNGAEGQNGRQFRSHFALLVQTGAECLATAAIDHKDDRQLSLLDEALDERMAHASCHIPINAADVVARLIFADFLEGDACPFEDAVISAAEQVFDRAAGP